MPKFKNLKEHRFGMLLVLDRVASTPSGQSQWLCRCDCGIEKTVRGYLLTNGRQKSCGCNNPNKTHNPRYIKHGHSRRNGKCNPTYGCWSAMIGRCFDPSKPEYARYGKIGIIVCDRWRTYQNFLDDMGPRPSPKHSIDRIRNTGGYEPGNCRWATTKEQGRNRTNNHQLTYNGITLTIAEWSEQCGVKRTTIHHRLKAGWPIEKVLTP